MADNSTLRELRSSTMLELSQRNFVRFRKLIHEQCGIHLHDGKKELVRARLSKRQRQTGHKDFSAYYTYLTHDASGEELVLMLNAISTNSTSFFRESKHFDFLAQDVLPHLEHKLSGVQNKTLHFWSSGCSTGEEPYSLAMYVNEYWGDKAQAQVKILATDISTQVLTSANAGVYAKSRTEKIPQHMLRKYFQKGSGKMSGYFRVKPEIRNMVEFRHFNLMPPFPFKEKFDIVLCRNVMIYFEKTAKEMMVNKYYDSLKTGGYFFIGHSESLLNLAHPFKYIKPTVYYKTKL